MTLPKLRQPGAVSAQNVPPANTHTPPTKGSGALTAPPDSESTPSTSPASAAPAPPPSGEVALAPPSMAASVAPSPAIRTPSAPRRPSVEPLVARSNTASSVTPLPKPMAQSHLKLDGCADGATACAPALTDSVRRSHSPAELAHEAAMKARARRSSDAHCAYGSMGGARPSGGGTARGSAESTYARMPPRCHRPARAEPSVTP